MSPITRDTRLAEQVGESLQAAARAVSFTPPAFDPDREPLVLLPDEAGAGRPRPHGRSRVRVLQLAAVAVVLVAVVAASLAVRRHDDRGDDVEVGTTPAAGLPDGLRAPSWVPEGLSLVSVGWATSSSGENPSAGHFQLFEASVGPGRLVVWASPMAAQITPTPGAVVRGRPVEVADLGGGAVWLIWAESGVTLNVRAEGLPTADVAAFLDGLAPRPGGLHEGFEPPASGPLALVSEGGEPASVAASLRTTLVYRGPGADDRLVLEADAPPAPPAPHTAAFWEIGERDHRPDHPLGPDSGAILTAPDRSMVRMEAKGGWTLPAADVRRLLDSFRAVTPVELAEMIDQADAAAGELPLVHEIVFRAATVEVRDAGGFQVICLRIPDEGPRRCAGLDFWSPLSDGTAVRRHALASLTVGDDWYVVLAGPGDADEVRLEASPSHAPFDPESAVADGWTFLLARVPSEVESVGSSMSPSRLGRPPSVGADDAGGLGPEDGEG
ncbi:MAG TPA: hypothetical protein VIL36_02465 [Acidimicrobiales bacterium]